MNKLDYIAKLEKAIEKRWGKEAVDNPRKHLTEEDQEKYAKEVEEMQKKLFKKEQKDVKVERQGYVVSESMLNKESRNNCEVCNKYSFKSRDDLYLTKFGVCYDCYFQYIEGREERWHKGWRPENNET